MTLAALYEACAALSAQVSATSGTIGLFGGSTTNATNRCTQLKALGLLTATTTAAQADESITRLNQAGWEADSNPLFASHFFSYAATAVAVTYANAYARANVKDNLCNYSFGAVDGTGKPAAAPTAGVQGLFGNGNGVPPTGPIQLINNASQR